MHCHAKYKSICSVILKMYFILPCLCIFCHCWSATNTKVLRPRGVSLKAKVFYDPSKEFSCLDGSGTFPFYYVNDDYCDCDDGTDEPGTAACPSGRFHCSNLGYISKDIPSSRVNDKICDCCDGSDEYNSSAECLNLCSDLGKEAKAAAEKQQELYQKGYQLWQEYSTQGKQKKESNKVKMQNLQLEEGAAEKVKLEKESTKNEVEEVEKAALAKYEDLKEKARAAAEEAEKLKLQEEDAIHAREAFNEMDMNSDGILSFDEVMLFSMFDADHDGTVSVEEGKMFLNMKESMELDEFITSGWMAMKPVYMLNKTPPTTSSTETAQEDLKNEEDYDSDDKEDDLPDEMLEGDEDQDEDIPEPPTFPPNEASEKENEVQKTSEYDEDTQNLINAAEKARTEFREASDKLDNIKEEIKQLQSDIEADFGSEEQFGVLKGQCFDFDDREYTYRLCPFDRASQIPKSGGSETSLGRWGHWAGPEDDKYSKMKYENGQGCWNGPARSTMVLLHCGLENRILSASEPNRCEYLFDFNTPSLCFNPQDKTKMHQHTEL